MASAKDTLVSPKNKRFNETKVIKRAFLTMVLASQLAMVMRIHFTSADLHFFYILQNDSFEQDLFLGGVSP